MRLQVGILAENSASTVDRAAAALGYPAEAVIRLQVPEGALQNLAAPFTGALSHNQPIVIQMCLCSVLGQ